jgi:integrase/recombinase XerD
MFAVSAVTQMRVEDYFPQGKRWWFRLHEKGGKHQEVLTHHKAEEFVDAWLRESGLEEHPQLPLFPSFDRQGCLSDRPLYRQDVLRMIKRRAAAAALPASTRCHTFRATGITAYLANGGTLEKAQAIAAHESPRTTKLYDRTSDSSLWKRARKSPFSTPSQNFHLGPDHCNAAKSKVR